MIVIAVLILIAAFYMTHYVGGIIMDLFGNFIVLSAIVGLIILLVMKAKKRRRGL